MTLRLDEVRRVAELARLQLSAEEEELYAAQLSRVVDYIDQLSAYEPDEKHRSETLQEASDEPRPSLPIDEFLANAPEKLDRFLLVPQVKKA